MRKRLCMLLAFVMIASMAMSLSACASYNNFKDAFFGEPTAKAETIKIAVYEPMTGPDAKAAQAEIRGIELAHEMYDTCLGKNVELVYADNHSDLLAADEAVSDLLTKGVSVVLGSYGSVYSLAAVSKLEAAQIPAISATNSNPVVTNSNPFYFSVNFMDTYDGIAMAKYAVEQAAFPEIVTVAPYEDDFSGAVVKSFTEKVMQLSGNLNIVKANLTYERGASDFSELLDSISKANVFGVFLMANTSDAVKIITQARESGISSVFMGPTIWDTDDLLGQFNASWQESISGVVFTSNFDSREANTEKTQRFAKAYCDKYQVETPPDGAALGFDAYCLALDAITRAGTADDGEAIRVQLDATYDFHGASGSITLDDNGEPIKSVAIKRLSLGKSEAFTSIEPKWGTAPEEAEETIE